MSLSGDVGDGRGAAGPGVGGASPLLDAGTLRLRAYTLCLLAAFAVYAFVFLWSSGFIFALACILIFALLSAALIVPGQALRFRLGALGATLAGALALAVPLAGRVVEGASLPAAVREATVWPHVLVLLFAGRLLAEICEARFALFWRDPFRRGGHNRTQSLLAAFFVGASLTLLFTQFTAGIAVESGRVDPAAIVLRAFAGQTAIHAAIILLFFTVLAAITDAALLSLNDSAMLGLLKRLCREAPTASLSRAGVARLARLNLAGFAHSRALQWVEAGAEPREAQVPSSLDGFHGASRRLIRALLSFLPLLGFLGTVIGLTAAIGGLPSGLGPQAKANLDIGASLLGLAVKFETTLLGLLGGLVGTFLLALLEKREAEVAAECRHLVEAAGNG